MNAVQVADGLCLVIFNIVSSTEVACHQRKVERFPQMAIFRDRSDQLQPALWYAVISEICTVASRSRWQSGMKPLDCWDRGFAFRRGHGCSSFAFVVYCAGSGLCDRLIAVQRRSGVCVCVISKHQQRGGLGSHWAVASP